MALLFCVFFLIAAGLGYPILNRFDPRQSPGLSDVKIYASMVVEEPGAAAGHVRYRVLVPWLARPFWRLAQDRVQTWDPVMFALLMVDSLFVAGTGTLIVLLGTYSLRGYGLALIAALLYLLNFAVPNLRLVGLVDAGEGFFLLALLVTLAERRYWLLPAIAVFGTLTKETFVPFSIVFTTAWYFSTRRDDPRHRSSGNAIWILCSWAAALATLVAVQRVVSGNYTSPWDFALLLHHGHGYFRHIISSLLDFRFWYIFLWLLPTSIPCLKRIPRPWLVATGAASVTAFLLDAYYGGEPGTIGRALFSVAGPVLSLSSAMFLGRVSGSLPVEYL